MKKIVCNVLFVAVMLNLMTSNAWCSITVGAPDATSTSALLGLAGLGLVAVRKFLR
jgi:MYXO-CTERM domain-containing protein